MRGGGKKVLGAGERASKVGGAPQAAGRVPGSAGHSVLSLQEEAKAKEEEGVPDEEGWVKVTRRGRRPVLPRTEAASLRVLDRERRKRARKELLNFYAWQHRETKMERKGGAQSVVLQPRPERRAPTGGTGTWVWSGGRGVGGFLDTGVPTGSGIRVPTCSIPCGGAPVAPCDNCGGPGLLRRSGHTRDVRPPRAVGAGTCPAAAGAAGSQRADLREPPLLCECVCV